MSVALRPRDSGIEVEKLKSISIFEVIHVLRMKNVTLRIEDVRTSVYLNRCMQNITKTLPIVIIYFFVFSFMYDPTSATLQLPTALQSKHCVEKRHRIVKN